MSSCILLIENIDKIHTTQMGIDRIKRNLNLDTADVVGYCKDLIMKKNCHIYRQGKNWYCEADNVRLTVNSYSYTIITAHIIKHAGSSSVKINRNTPALETERLILRKFTDRDIEALFLILKDKEVNRFLPWYPMKNLEETKNFYKERFVSKYMQPQGYAYAICLKSDNIPIGYITVAMEDHHDFGYGLRREFWHGGIVTEAGKAVVEQVKKDGLPYITATHDRNNPRSGRVMQKLGMVYCYSYEEQWQPKNFPVIFRMYQLNFNACQDFVYKKYWDMSDNRFIEEI